MKVSTVVLGILLILLGVGIMMYFVVVPVIVPSFDETPWLQKPFQTLFCNAGETAQGTVHTYRSGSGKTSSNLELTCVDEQGNVRDVNGRLWGVALAGFLIPFLAGLFMTIFGAQRYRRRSETIAAQAEFGAATRGLFSNSNDRSADPDAALDRLKALKTAFDQGLITEREYEDKRREILDGM